MPLFKINGKNLASVEQKNFSLEKELQTLVELNLETIFNCHLIASEFSTGSVHSGRIDTLGLSEDNNPVIIEYKKVESSELLNQSLYYLSWMDDHRGDYEIAVQKELGNNIEIDWSDIRVICIAPNYKKYDLHAVQVMGTNIELWSYRLFQDGSLYFEEIQQKSYSSGAATNAEGKNPVMVEAGKKAARTKATATYSFEEHLDGKSKKIVDLAHEIQDYLTNLAPSIEEVPKKFYIAYRTSQNIVCIELLQHRINLSIKLNPNEIDQLPSNARDVTNIGHRGTGNLEIKINNQSELEEAKPFLEKAYQKVGS